MNSSHDRVHRLFGMGTGMIVIVCVFGWALGERTKNRRALEEASQESAMLRAELAARDRTIADLQLGVEAARFGDASGLRSKELAEISTPSHQSMDLSAQLAQLITQQSNMAGLVQRLVAKTLEHESPEQAQRGIQAAIRTLQASMQTNQQQLNTARQRAATLLVDLNIPVDIATMEAGEALDKVNLREFWPFFEAKRESDTLQELADRLRRRMIQERVDGAGKPGELEALAQEGQQQLESARRNTQELLTTLNVPADLATMDANKALYSINLRPYWPFFEAKRERDLWRTVGERMQLRLIQEQIDAAAAAAKAASQ